ncbi:Uncharacterised protein [Bordetella pertussis]|nr:Uncharacterised protein [Bordetella pertussis]
MRRCPLRPGPSSRFTYKSPPLSMRDCPACSATS